MSFNLAPISLAGVSVGSTGTIDLTGRMMPGIYDPSTPNNIAHLRMHNQSGCGLFLQMVSNSHSFRLSDGGWIDIDLAPDETIIVWTVEYIRANASINLLLCTFYAVGERLPDINSANAAPPGQRVLTIDVPAGAAHTQDFPVVAIQLLRVSGDLLNISFAPRNTWAAMLAIQLYDFQIAYASSAYSYAEGAIQLLQFDNTPTLQRQDDLAHFIVFIDPPAGHNAANVFSFFPAVPHTIGFAPFNANTAQMALGVNITTTLGAGAELRLNWAANIDWLSNGTVPNIGQTTGATTGGQF